MPYDLGLQRYLPPEIFVEPPSEWERRLREVSPVTDRMQHLRFRFRAGQPSMLHPEAQRRGVWEIYACAPRLVVPKDRAMLFERHWSELPPDQQMGRRSSVTSYQHYMWHVHGVDARRFWVLQGERGGTPAAFSRLEERLLTAEGYLSEPLPIGTLPPCQFSEMTVEAIMSRDRLAQAGGDMHELERRNTSEGLKEEWDAAEKEYRKAFLGWWQRQMLPQAEFMKWYTTKSESDQTLRRATAEEANAATVWKDHFIETGRMPQGGVASSTAIAVPVGLVK